MKIPIKIIKLKWWQKLDRWLFTPDVFISPFSYDNGFAIEIYKIRKNIAKQRRDNFDGIILTE